MCLGAVLGQLLGTIIAGFEMFTMKFNPLKCVFSFPLRLQHEIEATHTLPTISLAWEHNSLVNLILTRPRVENN